MIQRRDFIKVLLLSLVTCGIYFWFFIFSVTTDINTMAGDGEQKDPTMCVVLSIVTCGIYSWYWWYIQGNRVSQIAASNNIRCDESGTTLILWAFLGSFIGIGPFIAMYFMCKNLNNLADCYNNV